MIDNAEEQVSKYYNTVGWETEQEVTEDARRWEDLREHAREYVSNCRLRVLDYIPDTGSNILDMGSGPIQYVEYLEYSRNFSKRYCVDLSITALREAKSKIGNHGVYLHGSFLNIPMKENFFDCSVSLHTIYHVNKNKQEEIVRKLIYVTKPEKPVIIVYSNPNTFISFPFRIFRGVHCRLRKQENTVKREEDLSLYFHAYPLIWWNRFSDVAYIKIMPFRSFGSNFQKKIIPDNKIGSKIFKLLFYLEKQFPVFFVKYFQYPMIILTKKAH